MGPALLKPVRCEIPGQQFRTSIHRMVRDARSFITYSPDRIVVENAQWRFIVFLAKLNGLDPEA